MLPRDAAQPQSVKRSWSQEVNILFSCSIVLYIEAVNLRPHCSLKRYSMIVLLSSVWTEFSNSVLLFKMYAKHIKWNTINNNNNYQRSLSNIFSFVYCPTHHRGAVLKITQSIVSNEVMIVSCHQQNRCNVIMTGVRYRLLYLDRWAQAYVSV